MQRLLKDLSLTAGCRRIEAPASGLASVDDVDTSCSDSVVDTSEVDSDCNCTSGAAAGPQGGRTAAEDTTL